MPDLAKAFDSEWVKAGLNAKQEDHLKFLDAGTLVPSKRDATKMEVVFQVAIVRDGDVVAKKKFSLNRSNFKAVSAIHGSDSDAWVGKEMRVNVMKQRNPSNGELVNGIVLSAPGIPGEVPGPAEEDELF